jgi:hypothetical protein
MPTSTSASARIAEAIVRFQRAEPALSRNDALARATALERSGRLRDDGTTIERVSVPRAAKGET